MDVTPTNESNNNSPVTFASTLEAADTILKTSAACVAVLNSMARHLEKPAAAAVSNASEAARPASPRV